MNSMKHISGQYYHIYNRGVEKRKIFASDENYRFLLRRIKEFLPEFIGLRQGALYDAAFVREQFGTPDEYRKFVEDDIPNAMERKLARYLLDKS